jgi:hypothetical protein
MSTKVTEEIDVDLSLTSDSRPDCQAQSEPCPNEAIFRVSYETACACGMLQQDFCVKHMDLVWSDIDEAVQVFKVRTWVCRTCHGSLGVIVSVDRI